MHRFLILVVLILIPWSSFSQSITGLYQPIKKPSDPMGGATFFITEDSTWGAMAFGVVQRGDIEQLNDSLFIFSRFKPQSPFMVYSRYNKALGDSMHIFMSDFSSGQYLIHFDKPSEVVPKVTKVFLDNANGFSYPYVAKFQSVKESISIARSLGFQDETYEFFYFENTKKHNDFVVLNTTEPYYQRDQIMVIKDERLYEMGRVRSGFNKVDEVNKEVLEMEKLVKKNIVYPETVYYSKLYKEISEEEVLKNWTFKKKKGYYTLGSKAAGGANEDYNYPSIIFPFELLNIKSESSTKAIFKKEPLFRTSLED